MYVQRAVSGAESFAKLVDDDLKNALLLYGASTKYAHITCLINCPRAL